MMIIKNGFSIIFFVFSCLFSIGSALASPVSSIDDRYVKVHGLLEDNSTVSPLADEFWVFSDSYAQSGSGGAFSSSVTGQGSLVEPWNSNLWYAAGTSANQNTQISTYGAATTYSGHGHADAYADRGGHDTYFSSDYIRFQSGLKWRFVLNEDHYYDFSGELNLTREDFINGLPGDLNALVTFPVSFNVRTYYRLMDRSGIFGSVVHMDYLDLEDSPGGMSKLFDFDGILGPGTYELEMYTGIVNTYGSGDAYANGIGLSSDFIDARVELEGDWDFEMTLSTQAVPVPPAIWFMAGGLIGLIMFRRKTGASAA
jgi:hypothetical protein